MYIQTICVGNIETNCYLVSGFKPGNGQIPGILIDPGAEADRILREVAKKNLKIEAILLTHGHYDHTGALEEVRKALNAKVYACDREREVLADPAKNLSGDLYVFGPGRGTSYAADVWVKDGDVLELAGLKLKVLHTPGHTEGSCCYYEEAEKVLFCGDTLFYRSCGRTDMPTGSMQQIAHSVCQILFRLPDDVTAYPGHMNETQIGYEKIYNVLAKYASWETDI